MIDGFKHAMSQAGLSTKYHIIADDKLHRFHVDGDKAGSKNGWYVLFDDGGIPAGSFGSWKGGIKQNWCAKSCKDLSPIQRNENKRRWEAVKQLREKEDKELKESAKIKAVSIWDSSSAAPSNHPYLVKKKVKSHGIGLHKGLLVIPIMDEELIIHSMQFIDSEGNKRFLSGGRKKGCFFPIGTEQSMNSLYIC